MADLVQELNSLDFGVYIGGPLQAAIQAQHAASMSQVEFIESVGFVEDTDPTLPSKLRYVDFEYKKSVPNPDYDPADPLSLQYLEENVSIKVPFLTMLTLPALRIDEMTIDFNAKLTSVETSKVSTSLGIDASLGINYKVVNFKASASYKRSTSRSSNIEKTYNMGVHVKAVNDELPAGLDRVLTMLEDSIVSA